MVDCVDRKSAVCGFCFAMALSCAKTEEKTVFKPQRQWVKRTVAVVAPVSDEVEGNRLRRTAGWFLENFREAQLYNTLAVDLVLEWHDELSEPLTSLAEELSRRDDIIAIIGPFANESVEIFASKCRRTHKPLIFPTASSEEIIRRFAVTSSGLSEGITGLGKNAHRSERLY